MVKYTSQLSLSKFSGVMVKYDGNTLLCCQFRTAEENFEAIKKALCILRDMSEDILFGVPEGEQQCLFEMNGGTVQFYRSY